MFWLPKQTNVAVIGKNKTGKKRWIMRRLVFFIRVVGKALLSKIFHQIL